MPFWPVFQISPCLGNMHFMKTKYRNKNELKFRWYNACNVKLYSKTDDTVTYIKA